MMRPAEGVRRRKKRGNKRTGGGGGGALQAQTIKVTVRKIADVDRFGSAEQVLTMVTQLVGKANEGMEVPIQLDQESIKKLVEAEELVAAAVAEAKGEEDDDDDEEGEDAGEESNDQETAAAADEPQKEAQPNEKTMADVVVGEQQPSIDPNKEVIAARALYVVPPRKSKRRGEKSGCAYLVLTAPLPDHAKPKPAPVKEPQVTEETATTVSEATATEGQPTPAPLAPALVVTTLTAAEKSRITAIGRLQLLNAVETMSNVAKEDAKSKQQFSGCTVEASPSGKAWRRDQKHRDRREGTIETTADYKRFMKNQEKHQDDLQSRPKPAPGGGVSSSSGPGDGDGQELSAIVLHLRARREEQLARKKAKRIQNKRVKAAIAAAAGLDMPAAGKKAEGKSSSHSRRTNNRKRKEKKASSGSMPQKRS